MTPSPYGPFADSRGVAKTAKKMCNDLECDTFVVEVAPFRYRAFSADHPGDQPKSGRIVKVFRWTPPKHYSCEHKNASVSRWSFFDGKPLQMSCDDCGMINDLCLG